MKRILLGLIVVMTLAIVVSACERPPSPEFAELLAEKSTEGTALWMVRTPAHTYVITCSGNDTIHVVSVMGSEDNPQTESIAKFGLCGEGATFWEGYVAAKNISWKRERLEEAMTTLQKIIDQQ